MRRPPVWRSIAVVSLITATLFPGPVAATVPSVQDLPIQVHAAPGLESLATSVVLDPAVWRPLPGIGAPFDVLVDTVRVWIVPDLAALDSIGLARTESWVAGVADPATLRIAIPTGALRAEADLRATMRHEVAHLGIHAATAGNYPLWLTEGFAQLAAGRWGVDEAWRLRFAFAREGGESLNRLRLQFRRGALDAELDYMLAYTAVHQLYSMGGEAGLQSLFAELAAGRSLDAALRTVHGVTEAQFEAAWRRSVTERYGWLYLVSRASVFWIVITLLVAWFSFLRYRRDRLRMDELRAWESTLDADGIPYGVYLPDWHPGPGPEPDPHDDHSP